MKNISVVFKLTIGFSIALIFMLLLAISNNLNLNKVVLQSDNIYEAGQIGRYAQALDEASLEYQLAVDPVWIESYTTNASNIQSATKRIAEALVIASNRSLMTDIAELASTHQQGFTLLVNSENEQKTTISELFSKRGQILPLAQTLQQELTGSRGQPILHDNFATAIRAQNATELLTSLNEMFFLARVYLMDMNTGNLKSFDQAAALVQNPLNALRPVVSSAQRTALESITQETDEYIRLVHRITELGQVLEQARNDQSSARQEMQAKLALVMDGQNSVRNQASATASMTGWVMTIVAIFASILVGFYLTRQITGPLQNAVQIAEAIGQRDMTGINVEQRHDEFGTLLNALDLTRSNLRGALSEVNEITTHLAVASEELSVITGQTSSGVHNQRTETEQVATAMNEMTATVSEVAQNSEEAAAAANSADEQARAGESVLQTALAEINKLTTEVHQSSAAIVQLNQDSESINTVLTVINGIAEQTNLLALNAAIEAARAGEAGRGFAVVADEVRALAQRTQESTAEIESLIANLQNGSSNAVQMMETSEHLADSAQELTQQASERLTAITQTVSEIQAMNMQIATAAEEQSLVADEINRSVVNVNGIADQSAAAVEETSAASAELAQLGQALQGLVGQFKIE